MSDFTLTPMTMNDYDEVFALWHSISGFAMRSIDDSREGVERFLSRNPGMSVVARDADGKIAGSILCGHDGRQGQFYHVCVRQDLRRHGIGKEMVVFCMKRLQEEKINKIRLIAFETNENGNAFWNGIGWEKAAGFNCYDFTLNEKNIIAFNK